MSANGLRIAPHKTEAVLLMKKWRYDESELYVDGQRIGLNKSVCYLRVELNRRLTFTSHLAKASSSATIMAVSIGRPGTSKREPLAAVVHNKLLYAASIWAGTCGNIVKNVDMIFISTA